MKIYLDIGSTCIKVFIAEENYSYYVDRDYNIEPGYQVKSILEKRMVTREDTVFISSSANGGLRVVLIGLTASLSSKLCYSLISSSGGNIVQSFIGDKPDFSKLLDDKKVDIYIIAGGTNGYISFKKKETILRLITNLKGKGAVQRQ
jgi:hypothetical protein